jgi:hypothetical protein
MSKIEKCRVGVVGAVIRLLAILYRVGILARAKEFHYSTTSIRALWLTQTSRKWSLAFFSSGKAVGELVEQSLPSGAEVTSEWSCMSPPMCFHGMYRISLSVYNMGTDCQFRSDSYH